MAYRVDLARLASKIGERDKRTRMESRRRLLGSFAGQRFGDQRGFSIAVSNLLIGPPFAARHTDEASQLGYALEALCDAYGTSLFNNPVSPFRGDFLHQVDAHMKSLGVDMVLRMVFRGPPLGVPEALQFPTVGYLERSELEALSPRFEGVDLRAVTEPLRAESAMNHAGFFDAAEMFRDWVREALAHRESIVTFFY